MTFKQVCEWFICFVALLVVVVPAWFLTSVGAGWWAVAWVIGLLAMLAGAYLEEEKKKEAAAKKSEPEGGTVSDS